MPTRDADAPAVEAGAPGTAHDLGPHEHTRKRSELHHLLDGGTGPACPSWGLDISAQESTTEEEYRVRRSRELLRVLPGSNVNDTGDSLRNTNVKDNGGVRWRVARSRPLAPKVLPEAVAEAVGFIVSRWQRDVAFNRFSSPGYLLASRLRSHPELAHLGPSEATATVGAVLEELSGPDAPDPWVGAGLPDQGSDGSVREPSSDFARGWAELGQSKPNRLEEASRLAREYPLQAIMPIDKTHRAVASLAYYLARQTEPEPFLLSCRTAGSLVGVTHATAANWLRVLREEGDLVVAGEHKLGERATTYYWTGSVGAVRSPLDPANR